MSLDTPTAVTAGDPVLDTRPADDSPKRAPGFRFSWRLVPFAVVILLAVVGPLLGNHSSTPFS